MKRFLGCCLVALWVAGPRAHADATLVYELDSASSGKVEKTLSISYFFARVDSSDEEGRYLLFQAGKFFPLYSVDAAEETYTRLTPPVEARLGPKSRTKQSEAEPDPDDKGKDEGAAAAKTTVPSPAQPPRLKATTKKDEVAGVSCRVVQEIVDDEPAVEHCMANKAALGLTDREMRTLARLVVLARQRGWDWLGAATEDEEFVSVRSRALEGNALWELASVSTAPLPQEYLRISREFTAIPYQAPTGGPADTGAEDTEAPAAEQAAPEPAPAPPVDESEDAAASRE